MTTANIEITAADATALDWASVAGGVWEAVEIAGSDFDYNYTAYSFPGAVLSVVYRNAAAAAAREWAYGDIVYAQLWLPTGETTEWYWPWAR